MCVSITLFLHSGTFVSVIAFSLYYYKFFELLTVPRIIVSHCVWVGLVPSAAFWINVLILFRCLSTLSVIVYLSLLVSLLDKRLVVLFDEKNVFSIRHDSEAVSNFAYHKMSLQTSGIRSLQIIPWQVFLKLIMFQINISFHS